MTDGGAGLLGNNLFIYCADNPVNNFDPSGSSIIDVLNRADKNIREAVVKTISKTKGTYTKGFSLTGTPGIWNFNIQAGIFIDTDGNVAIQGT